jgi:hypothetical protein
MPRWQRVAFCLFLLAVGILCIVLAAHPGWQRYRGRLVVCAVGYVLAGVLGLCGVNLFRGGTVRPSGRNALHETWRGLRLSLRMLGVVGAGWLVLFVISSCYPVTSPVAFVTFFYSVAVFWFGLFWAVGVCVRDGVWEWGGIRRMMRNLAEYSRACPDRAGKPFWLAMFAALSFLATFGLFLLKEHTGTAPPPAAGGAGGPAVPQVGRLFERGPREPLADLPEFGVKAGPWPFAKNGTVGDGRPIRVNGVASPKGLGMHPPEAGYSAVKYRLGGQAAVFKAAVALNDTANDMRGTAVFEVLGDGRRLWQSVAVDRPGRPQECSIDVTGVDVLELRVHAPGSYWGLHAVWVEPRLLQAADTPNR